MEKLYTAGRFSVVAAGIRFAVIEDILNGTVVYRGSKFATLASASAHADRWNAKWTRSVGVLKPAAGQ